ncbi:hypothetical protein CI109_104723 [Kwoniella shandongensis]|uniref:Uncharacterized protein n=1 Tax=Kwoniella shandongensis TaxID=1734106 RepID=A0A5M6BPN6_9TREE|nr:uncharacterized protein CI109_006965 [Kwoniella shandongensis]KAA5524707.1 hypothetical protein CI109_006965 [Kwoniella shandongensis]
MQGFNRYIPPDYDPKNHSTLNSAAGKKHALGNRAKDIDKGILIVRFELPFNIWCGSCNAHLGAGVRYNAQKRKVGNYFSTPIYAFRCKCHLCSGWFEIRTDPKNAAYVVEEGARKKDEDWNPEENGGFAVHDTEAPSAAEPPADPFAAVEKTIDQATWAKRGTSRLTELTTASDRLSGDPYRVSTALRRKFREEKKVMLEKQGRDDDLRLKYGLGEEVDLGDEVIERGREMWIVGRERKGLSVEDDKKDGEGSSARSVRVEVGTPPTVRGKGKGRANDIGSGAGGGSSPSLAQVLRKQTIKKYDPFSSAVEAFVSTTTTSPSSVQLADGMKVRGKIKDQNLLVGGVKIVKVKETAQPQVVGSQGLGGGLLAGYGSD